MEIARPESRAPRRVTRLPPQTVYTMRSKLCGTFATADQRQAFENLMRQKFIELSAAVVEDHDRSLFVAIKWAYNPKSKRGSLFAHTNKSTECVQYSVGHMLQRAVVLACIELNTTPDLVAPKFSLDHRVELNVSFDKDRIRKLVIDQGYLTQEQLQKADEEAQRDKQSMITMSDFTDLFTVLL